MFSLDRWYTPNWLYALLPYLYFVAGVLTILTLRNGMGVFSGFMLIMAGVIVWRMRSGYKDLQVATKEKESKKESEKDNRLVHIVWRPSFNSGHKIIDDQHRELFIGANKTIDAITNGQMNLVVNEELNELIKDIRVHFKTENKFLEKFAPEIAEFHKEKHAELLEETRVIVERVRNEDVPPRELIGFLVFDVITNHLIREDLTWQEMLNQKNVG